MPSNLLTADTSFPNLKSSKSTDEKFGEVSNYLYMLLEQLRYTLGNLGVDNFNDSEIESLANIITEPVYIQLQGMEGEYASLTADVDNLTSRVGDAEGNITVLQQTSQSLVSSVSDIEGNYTTLQQTVTGLTSTVSNVQGELSSLEQYTTSITLSVTNGEDSSTIRLMAGSTQISSQVVQFTGVVTFTDLSTSGATVINGNNITTGTISADRINLTGAITWNDLATDAKNQVTSAQNTASSAQSTASSAQNTANTAYSWAYSALNTANSVDNIVSGWQYNGGTYLGGTMLVTSTVTATKLQGGQVTLLDSTGASRGIIYVRSADTADSAIEMHSNGAMALTTGSGNLYLQGVAAIQLSSPLIQPDVSYYSDLGSTSYRWRDIYLNNSPSVSSDQSVKYDIEDLPEKYVTLFDRMNPCRFKLLTGTSGRYHTGFIAQQVKEAMDFAGVSDMEFGGWISAVDEEGNHLLSLRYEEMIALVWAKVKQLEERITG